MFVGCIAPLTSNSICGTWSEYCSPASFSVNTNFDSISATFSYEGPVPPSQNVVLSGDVCVVVVVFVCLFVFLFGSFAICQLIVSLSFHSPHLETF